MACVPYWIYLLPMTKKLLLADDHQIILDGLKKIIEEDPSLEIVGMQRNGEEVLKALKKQQVDILCMDIEMPIKDGVEVSKIVKEEYPDIKILILSMYNRPELVKQLAGIGVDGFVKKDAGKLELLLAIEQLGNGDTYYSQHFTQSLIESQHIKPPEVQLTTREKEILQLLSEGKNSHEIAEALFISPHTVQTHRKNLLSKFDVNNTTTLISKASHLGIISLK